MMKDERDKLIDFLLGRCTEDELSEQRWKYHDTRVTGLLDAFLGRKPSADVRDSRQKEVDERIRAQIRRFLDGTPDEDFMPKSPPIATDGQGHVWGTE